MKNKSSQQRSNSLYVTDGWSRIADGQIHDDDDCYYVRSERFLLYVLLKYFGIKVYMEYVHILFFRVIRVRKVKPLKMLFLFLFVQILTLNIKHNNKYELVRFINKCTSKCKRAFLKLILELSEGSQIEMFIFSIDPRHQQLR